MDLKGIRPAVGVGRKIHIETYGCQMNVVDSETVLSIMQTDGFVWTDDVRDADVILLNTCSIRDNAEQRIWNRLDELCGMKRRRKGLLIGLIGCMAERLRERIIEERPAVDIVAGPDAYRSLPTLVVRAEDGGKGIDTELSKEETYAEISPVRLDANGVSAFVSIMRGCNNFCSYCVVPYTRGRERSRDPQTILREVRELFDAGYREVTLLGQNVNSYSWGGVEGGLMPAAIPDEVADGDGMRVGDGSGNGTAALLPAVSPRLLVADERMPVGKIIMSGDRVGFPELLRLVAGISPLLRVRFATSHPKDMSDELLDTMAAHPNICRAIHLPAQSGSSRMLDRMNRKYTREWYLDRIAAIRRVMPDCAVSTDLIAGFSGETPEDHAETLSLMREVGYEFAFMFKYSEREGTVAARTMPDDVPDEVKTARLTEIIALQNELSLASNRRDVGREFEILVEGFSKRSRDKVFGRTSQNKVVVIDRAKKGRCPTEHAAVPTARCDVGGGYSDREQVYIGEHSIGDYVRVRITGCSSATLQGEEV